MAKRKDYVWIRKSGEQQDDEAQINNVKVMLGKLEKKVPPKSQWLIVTKGRRKVHKTPEFKQLKKLIEAGEVRTVWVESQDRLGVGIRDTADVFSFVKLCRRHGTKVYDLTDDEDLTTDDFQTNLMVLVRNDKSQRELSDKARRSLRTRVNNFVKQAKTSWPTGPHPFGYAKRCFAVDGTLKWEWQPASRTEGIAFDFDNKGKRRQRNGRIEKLPRKERSDIIVLVPHDNKKFVRVVQLVFEYYARLNISRREISRRLNKAGYTFYDKPFSHSYVTQILGNPAYAGDIHFGKSKAGDLYTFGADGTLTKITDAVEGQKPTRRAESERLIKKDTHQALIDRDLWQLAKRKLELEQKGTRASYAPRNENYFLKQLLVCGHCRRNMVGRTDSKSKVITYVCSSYVNGKINGVLDLQCGYHSIRHDKAEELLLTKLGEVGKRFEIPALRQGQEMLFDRFETLCSQNDADRSVVMEEFVKRIVNGVKAVVDVPKAKQPKLETAARRLLRHGRLKDEPVKGFANLVKQMETKSVNQASKKLTKVRDQLERVTRAWALADEDDQRILLEQKAELKQQLAELEPKTMTLSERWNQINDTYEHDWQSLRTQVKEIKGMEKRAKGERFIQLLERVVLYWDRKWHPASAKPTRPRKTKRKGRYSYTLLEDQIEWGGVITDLVGSW